ncbi:Uncharacterised protein [Acinetobacter junii]|uniref:GNAT family N-acetyltransferase n=1 Tax=Acinetobacter junii TaxID=40215 RepID=UPI00195CD823|nr:GNAT family protein [Acinetobacter junii]VTX84839.1 Uncharacterised protein [Acinetobacter junii]
MYRYQETQENKFGQLTSFSVEHFKPCELVRGKNIEGNYVNLIDINSEVSNRVFSQIWNCVATEPDESCWTYLPYAAPLNLTVLTESLKNSFNFKDSTHFLIEIEGEICGWIALLNPRLDNGAIEIGNVYFSHRMKKSRSATETIFLLLQQCFKQRFRRIEWKCDDCNQPSKAAALRLGFQYEGLFRQDRIVKGRNRNTAWFSIIDEEWSDLEPAYQQWLSPENFDAKGIQKKRLSDFI